MKFSTFIVISIIAIAVLLGLYVVADNKQETYQKTETLLTQLELNRYDGDVYQMLNDANLIELTIFWAFNEVEYGEDGSVEINPNK